MRFTSFSLGLLSILDSAAEAFTPARERRAAWVGGTRWAPASPCPACGIARKITATSTRRCSPEDAPVACVDVLDGVDPDFEGGLDEEGELLEQSEMDGSPQEIVEFFASPSYEAVDAGAEAQVGEVDLSESTMKHLIVLDSFLEADTASQLRGIFDKKLSKPREGNAERFVWDWWHVPDQYTLMRTPAEDYFGAEAFAKLLQALTKFGQDTLGCTAISPPWLSLYVDGCEQRFHTDSWHGPWAFVLSLTDWEGRGFTGGETMILKPHVLEYWRSFQPGVGLEEKHFLDLVEPQFNRLTAFDPRFPHGVRAVGGTRDPLKGRLVLHGWFTDPETFFAGGLSEDDATEPLNKALDTIYPALDGIGRVTGLLTVRLHVSSGTGKVLSVVALSNTLIPDPNGVGIDEDGMEEDVLAVVLDVIREGCLKASFPPATEDTFITIPFVFQ